MAKRRSLSHMVGGGLVEIAAVGVLIFLVAGGRLHRGESVSAEPTMSSPRVIESRDPWRTSPDIAEPEEGQPQTLWSLLPSWESWSGSSSPTVDEESGRGSLTKETEFDEEFVERQLTESAEALKQWIWRQAEQALRVE
jgi:hypothetical protein